MKKINIVSCLMIFILLFSVSYAQDAELDGDVEPELVVEPFPVLTSSFIKSDFYLQSFLTELVYSQDVELLAQQYFIDYTEEGILVGVFIDENSVFPEKFADRFEQQNETSPFYIGRVTPEEISELEFEDSVLFIQGIQNPEFLGLPLTPELKIDAMLLDFINSTEIERESKVKEFGIKYENEKIEVTIYSESEITSVVIPELEILFSENLGKIVSTTALVEITNLEAIAENELIQYITPSLQEAKPVVTEVDPVEPDIVPEEPVADDEPILPITPPVDDVQDNGLTGVLPFVVGILGIALIGFFFFKRYK